MQQQQQHADFDLLAVFSDETKADTAVAKLRKEGFSEEEVHQLAAGNVGSGQFREHGPNRSRSEYFLQTRHAGPNPIVVVLLAVVFGLVLGGLSFGASFAFPVLPEPITLIVGIVVGLVLGALIGLLRRGRVQGDIGQNKTKPSAPVEPIPTRGARTVVALRFPSSENISRKSRARAILLNTGGKIDRSVGRRE